MKEVDRLAFRMMVLCGGILPHFLGTFVVGIEVMRPDVADVTASSRS